MTAETAAGHIIGIDSDEAKGFGFTSDKFDGWLGKDGNYIYISFIISKHPGRGNFSALMEAITRRGFGIKIPTPMGIMESIVAAKGFRKTSEWFPAANEQCEVWVKDVAAAAKEAGEG